MNCEMSFELWVKKSVKFYKMTKIYIVDDHSVVIEGVVSLLQNLEEIKVCGHGKSANECLLYLENNVVDIILMDINLPDINGVELCAKVKATHPNTKIIALSTYNQISYINRMIASGASGYLLKNITKEELTLAINTVMEGKNYYSAELLETINLSKKKGENASFLTKRENDILKLVVEGLTNPQIGERLFISTDTVDSHRKNLHTKLNVNNTALLVRYAIENGLV
jgi:DNA-binding NarL/FixJ family response regulator